MVAPRGLHTVEGAAAGATVVAVGGSHGGRAGLGHRAVLWVGIDVRHDWQSPRPGSVMLAGIRSAPHNAM